MLGTMVVLLQAQAGLGVVHLYAFDGNARLRRCCRTIPTGDAPCGATRVLRGDYFV